MGFFSNLNIEQETDLEYPAVHQAEEAALKAEPAYTSPSVEPADGVKAVSVAAGAPKADETGNTQPAQQTEEEKRKAHEAAEEKRKAEWEERQRLRREKEQIEWEKAVALDNNALIAASVKRLGDAMVKRRCLRFFAALRLGERYIPGFLVGCVRLTGYSDRGAEFCREVEPGRGGI